MDKQSSDQASSDGFSIFRFLRASLGLGAGTSILAYLSGNDGASSDEKTTTLGDVFSNIYAQLLSGYQAIIEFIAGIDAYVAGGFALALCAILAKLYNRRITTTTSQKQYFDSINASNIPHTRIGYSDRMSYTMGELAELAYIPCEDISYLFTPALSPIENWAEKLNIDNASKDELNNILKNVSSGTEHFEEVLKKGLKTGSFNLIEPYLSNQTIEFKQHQTPNNISKLSAQGFVCYHKNPNPKKSFIVVAFRGSESNVEDWLTNGDAQPLIDAQIAQADMQLLAQRKKFGFAANPAERSGRVHKGFYGAFLALAPQIMKNIQTAKTALGEEDCPVYFTGHSLGGAMATIAARELLPDSNGAVYSYGAPRVADYNYFNGMKTPIFRVVNSSDIVPRVPPGVYAPIFKLPIYVVRWVFSIRQGIENPEHPLLSKLLDKAEKYTDSLSYYRHYGDLRYLTDVAESKEVKAEILSNPSKFDQVFWFFTAIGASFGKPIKSHSMQIYRNKLKNIAAARNKK